MGESELATFKFKRHDHISLALVPVAFLALYVFLVPDRSHDVKYTVGVKSMNWSQIFLG